MRADTKAHSEWDKEHGDRALAEGWFIFELFGSTYGDWQISRVEDPARMSQILGVPVGDIQGDDDEAWRIVLSGTGPHHLAALSFIAKWNPVEYEVMMKFKEREGLR